MVEPKFNQKRKITEDDDDEGRRKIEVCKTPF